MSITLVEQETVFTMSADDRNTWHVFCDDPILQRRLEKIGATLIRTASNGIGKFYELPANQLTLRKPAKPLSEARKLQLANRLRAMREAPTI